MARSLEVAACTLLATEVSNATKGADDERTEAGWKPLAGEFVTPADVSVGIDDAEAEN